MKKTVVLLLTCLMVFSLLISSCGKNNKDTGSGISSEIIYYEESSTIAKTETDGSFTFAFDPYVLPEDVKKALGTTANYKKLAKAVINREECVSMASQEDFDEVRLAIGENFPFSFLIKGLKYDFENNRVLISYNYDKTHDGKIEEIENAVGNIFDECVNNNDDDVIAAVSIYGWLAQNIKIAEEEKATDSQNQDTVSSEIAQTETSSEQSDVTQQDSAFDFYTTLVDKEASQESVAALYNFLLLQLGIEGKTVACWQNNQYHTWNMICLDSKWYHCDISKEQKETEGTGLKFFGLNKERLAEYITVKDVYTGQSKWFTNDIPKANSGRFNDFEKVISWEISSDRDSIDAFTEEYSRFVFEI